MELVKNNKQLSQDPGIFFPRLELKETKKNYTVSVEIAGMKEKDIHASVKGNSLIIEGEKKYETESEDSDFYSTEFSYGSFYRNIPIPEIVSKKLKTSYKDGVFFIILDKIIGNVLKKRKKKTKKKLM